MLIGLFWPLWICRSATLTSNAVSSIDNMIYNSNWINFPIHLQKFGILIVQKTRKPKFFHGFKIVPYLLIMTIFTNRDFWFVDHQNCRFLLFNVPKSIDEGENDE